MSSSHNEILKSSPVQVVKPTHINCPSTIIKPPNKSPSEISDSPKVKEMVSDEIL